jgi:hypothetical protein
VDKPLSKREGLLLFWCEGDKPTDDLRKIQLTNSNSTILEYFTQWLEIHYGIPRKVLKMRLHLWEESDELRAKKFWSERLQIPSTNFTKTWFKPRGRKDKHPFGICRVSVSSKTIMERVRNDLTSEFLT